MSTTKQKQAAKKNIAKAREIQSERAHGIKIPRQTRGLSTADQDKLPDSAFAFPKERKEPLTDAKHIRNAIARFDQVEGITDKEKDAAWNRIMKAAKKCDVDVSESSWRELGKGGKIQATKSSTVKSRTIGKSPSAKSPAAKSQSIRSSASKSSASKSSASKSSSTSKPKTAAGKK